MELGRFGSYPLHLRRVDPHWLLHQEGVALIEQVVRYPGHLPVPPKCHDEVGARRLQHLLIVCECRRVLHLGRSFDDETGIGVLDADQLHVWHGDEVAQVGGVVECMPMTYLDGSDANSHGRPLRGLAPSPKVPSILTSMDAKREVGAARPILLSRPVRRGRWASSMARAKNSDH